MIRVKISNKKSLKFNHFLHQLMTNKYLKNNVT